MRKKAKIVTPAALARISRRMARDGKRLVLTNGCFDLLHGGHGRLLAKARRPRRRPGGGGGNSDSSVRKLKGREDRWGGGERAKILAALEAVDFVVPFRGRDSRRAPTSSPLRARVLVKGGDWGRSRIVGRSTVEADGAEVRVLPRRRRWVSTSRIILRRIQGG